MNHQQENRRLMKSTFHVAAPTLLSRVLGYLRDMLQAKYLGTTGSADAFNIAYVIPNLLRRLTGEGAMAAAFIPVFTQLKKEKTKKELWRFANCFFYDMTVLMAALTILGIITSPLLVKFIASLFKTTVKVNLTIVLSWIMFPYLFLVSLAALAMAILNSFRKFFIPALAPVLFNLSIITAAALFAGRTNEPAYVFAAGVVAGGVLQLALQLPSLWKTGMRFQFGLSFTHPAVKKVAMLMIPGIFGVGISQINFAISRALAWSLETGSVSSLYYSTRVQELTLGVFSIAFSIALLPTFSEQAAQRDIASMKKTLEFSVKLISFITFPAMVGLMILNRPIIRVLFERGVFNVESTMMTSSCLLFFAIGLPFISYVKVIAPAFYSLKDTKTPVIVAFFVMIIYLSLSFVLMRPMRVSGIALALSISSVFNFLFLYLLLEKKIGKIQRSDLLSSALKSAFSAAVMGGVVWLFMGKLPFTNSGTLPKIGFLLAAILAGIATYAFLGFIVNREEIRAVIALLFGKKGLKK